MKLLIKIIMLVVPLAIVVAGVIFIIQAGRFWLDVTAPSQVQRIGLEWNKPVPLQAVVFAPSSIRPQDSPISVEVEVKQLVGDLQGAKFEVAVEVSDKCDYVRVDNATTILTFDDTHSETQSASAVLVVRNMIPPIECPITVNATSNDAVATSDFSLLVNAWTGHLLAVAKLLFGFIGSILGLRGIRTIFGT